ncbi:hypothetical protein EOM86_06660 [Candidatus Nomurabacteria bacterium]|nr:hypothetical protein [Candidatus Nomurabacteria bacterium]
MVGLEREKADNSEVVVGLNRQPAVEGEAQGLERQTAEPLQAEIPESYYSDEPVTFSEIMNDGVTWAMNNPKSFAALSFASAKTGAGLCAGAGPVASIACGTAGLLAPAAVAVMASSIKAMAKEPEDFREQKAETERDFREMSAFDQSFAEGLTAKTVISSNKSELGEIAGQMTGLVLLSSVLSPIAATEAAGATGTVLKGLPFGIGMGVQSTVRTANEALDLNMPLEDVMAMSLISGGTSFIGNTVGFALLPAGVAIAVDKLTKGKMLSPFVSKLMRPIEGGMNFAVYGESEQISKFVIGKGYDAVSGKNLYKDEKMTTGDTLVNFAMGWALTKGTQTLGGFLKSSFNAASRYAERRSVVKGIARETQMSASQKTQEAWLQFESSAVFSDKFANGIDRKMSKQMETKVIEELRGAMKTSTDKQTTFADWLLNNLEPEYYGEKNFKRIYNSVWN